MAIRALPRRHRVLSRQGKSGAGVVERPVGPRRGVMALLASRRQVRGRVRYGRDCVVVVRLVTGDAGRIRDVVVAVDVAIRTLPRRHHVRSGQRERRLRVIEGRRLPCARRVAGFASLGESSRHVIGIRCPLEILQVARHAGRARQVVIPVHVAIGTLPWRHRVLPRQGEVHRAVIERRRRPSRRAVALVASRREIRRHVARIGRLLEVRQVAAHARRSRQIVVIAHVAIRTLTRRHGVHPRQREPRRVVIELRVQPVIRGVARVAGHSELAGCVIRVIRVQVIGLVTRITLRRHRLELAGGAVLVTRIAIHRRMRSGERETVIVILDLLHRDLPAANRVALFAIRAQLPAMDVGVAVLAALPHTGEDRLDVALRTRYGLVHAP